MAERVPSARERIGHLEGVLGILENPIVTPLFAQVEILSAEINRIGEAIESCDLRTATTGIGNAAYKLKLPNRLKVHPVFHVSFLKPYHEDLSGEERHTAVKAPPNIQEQFEKEVEEVLNHRVIKYGRSTRRQEYLVKWKGEPLEDATWEKDKTLWQSEDKIKEYRRNRPTRTSGSSSGGELSHP
ncbi:Chromo domain [Dillenia turbinata]|uniref:Chromo domain n=1 Tax=Dillenia turbinata TaxID=194707 RepID=A0AAN8V6J3_9MAGN